MSKKLNGKVAIVTGASKGIGASIAKHLAAEGASIVVNYASSKNDADRVVAEIVKAGGKAIAIKADLAQEKEVRHLFKEALKAYQKIDILVNNAGIYKFIPLEEVTSEFFHKIFDLNVLGLIFACQEAAKHFGSSGGSIINIGSIAGIKAVPTAAVYSASKAAVDAITRSLSSELGARKIRVNAINPGMVQTEGTKSGGFDEGEFRANIEANTPLQRIGQPQDIAPAVVFFASDESSWITGETLYISGGYR